MSVLPQYTLDHQCCGKACCHGAGLKDCMTRVALAGIATSICAHVTRGVTQLRARSVTDWRAHRDHGGSRLARCGAKCPSVARISRPSALRVLAWALCRRMPACCSLGTRICKVRLSVQCAAHCAQSAVAATFACTGPATRTCRLLSCRDQFGPPSFRTSDFRSTPCRDGRPCRCSLEPERGKCAVSGR